MEEEHGKTQVMPDSHYTPKPSHIETSVDSCGGCGKNESPICMPVCFLVREQAKSLVAIQNLQKRMQQLEGVQNNVISAISEVHDYLSVDSNSSEHGLQLSLSPRSIPSASHSAMRQDASSVPHSKKQYASASPLKTKLFNNSKRSFLSLSPRNHQWQKNETESEVQIQQQKIIETIRAKDSAPESDKQDSGLESDCRDHALESNIPRSEASSSIGKQAAASAGENNQDELLELLDEIGQRSQELRQHLSTTDTPEKHAQHASEEMPRTCTESSKLDFEGLWLQHMLSDIRSERDDLKVKIVDLENSTDDLASEKIDLEQRFLTMLVEKQKLETRMRGLHPGAAAVAYNNEFETADFLSQMKHMPKVNAATVSSVLKGTNVVDLQKQTLTHMMENEILRTKLEQMEQCLLSKEAERDCLEKIAREEIKQLISENHQWRTGFEQQKHEITALKTKNSILEDTVQSLTIENRELSVQLGESLYFQALQRNNGQFPPQRFSSSSCTSSGGSTGAVRRFSIPAQNANAPDIGINCVNSKLLPNVSSYVDVSVEDNADTELALTLEPTFGFSQRKSSTPMRTATKQQALRFSDIMKASPVHFSSGNLSRYAHLIQSRTGQKAIYNAQRPDEQFVSDSEILNCVAGSLPPSSSDKLPKRTPNACVNKQLSCIQENLSDSKNMEFYTLLEKLKSSNSNCKYTSRLSFGDESAVDAANCSAASSSASHNKSCEKASDFQNASHSSDVAGQLKTKEKKPTPIQNTLHKRIQNILDRITAEPDEAVV